MLEMMQLYHLQIYLSLGGANAKKLKTNKKLKFFPPAIQ